MTPAAAAIQAAAERRKQAFALLDRLDLSPAARANGERLARLWADTPQPDSTGD